MFYYKKWKIFCSSIVGLNIPTYRAVDLLNMAVDGQFIVFKHDVETNPIKALELAITESELGILGSYYVQGYLLDSEVNVKILQQIRDLGHEVSYHYDVLDANKGDFDKAKTEFVHYLQRFEENGFSVKTICQHGNPIRERVGYTSNRDFFRNEKISKEFNNLSDIVVDFKSKTNLSYIYISDAGYSWKLITDPENNDRDLSSIDIPLNGYEGILNILMEGKSIIISTHPHRWQSSFFRIYLIILLFKVIRTFVQFIRKIPLMEKLLSRFYFLAKKI